MNDKFIKTAQILYNTSHSDVVKVASLVRKLQNLWKSLSDPSHRETVNKLTKESVGTLHVAKKLNEHLKSLTKAIQDGDLNSYLASINQVKLEIDNLNKELERIRLETNERFNETAKQLPEGYDLNLDTKYEKAPLKGFNWFKDRSHELFLGTNREESQASIFLIQKTLKALKPLYSNIEEFKSIYFTGNNLEQFFINFIDAVFNGNVVGQVEDKKEYRILKVETVPFEIPNLGAKVQATVLLKDAIRTLDSPAKMSLRGTTNVRLVSTPIHIEEKEPSTIPSPTEELRSSEIKTITNRKDKLKKIALIEEQLIPYQRTTLSDEGLAAALKEGYKKAFGEEPSKEVLAAGWAQVALESGRPIKLPNNNVGNIKATPDWIKSGNQFFVKNTVEFTPEGKKYIEKATKWRAYPTPEDGAAGYWRLIGNRYKAALNWMEAGDPKSASVALGLKGYYTASPKQYATSVGRLYEFFMEKIAPKFDDLKSEPKPINSPKPELKEWAADYSKEEKDAILNPVVNKEVSNKEVSINLDHPPANDVDELIKKLLAYKKNKIVKNAKAFKNNALIIIKTEADLSSKIEYCRVTSSLIRNYLGIKTNICLNDKEVEINCSGYGSKDKLNSVLQKISDITAETMKNKTGINIYPIVISDMISKYAEIDIDNILYHKRNFAFKRIKDG